jgi:hypothetical protein
VHLTQVSFKEIVLMIKIDGYKEVMINIMPLFMTYKLIFQSDLAMERRRQPCPKDYILPTLVQASSYIFKKGK